jgi:hypothetical protein
MSEAVLKLASAGAPPPELTLTDKPPQRAQRRRAGPSPEQLQAKRDEMHRQQHANNANAVADEPDETPDPPEPREDLDSIEIQLPDGRMVEFGPPPGLSLTTKIAQMTAGRDQSQALEMIARVCLCVRSIDGRKRADISSMVDVHKVANALGDNALDGLAVLLAKTWPGVKVSELLIIKKNQRGS